MALVQSADRRALGDLALRQDRAFLDRADSRRVDRAARRPIRRLLCSVLLVVGVAGCHQTKMGTASGTIDLPRARGGPTPHVALVLDYPVEVTAGRACVVKFSLANQSDVAADIVRIRFDFDTAGDPYFQGFANEGTTPSRGIWPAMATSWRLTMGPCRPTPRRRSPCR